nr:immunoglobulin light chain precursor [Seriola quinqueradiata]
MTLVSVVMWSMLCCCFTESRGQVTVTQPGVVNCVMGRSVTISCRVSQNVYTKGGHIQFAWYREIYGELAKLFIYEAFTRVEGTPSCFTGSGSMSNFSLNISGVQTEDAGVYYCKSGNVINNLWVWIFGGGSRVDVGSDARPILMVLPPSSEELQQEKVIVLWLAKKGFPSDWSLAWKVEGSSSSSWEESRSPGVLEKDGLYSWSSTLRLPADQWSKLGSVTCEATQGSQTPLSETLRRDQCSQF